MSPLTDAVRVEWLRFTTVRATWVLCATGVLLAAVTAALVSAAIRPDPLDDESLAWVVTGGAVAVKVPFVALMTAVAATLGTGHDYRFRLVQPLLLGVPQRGAVVAARLVVLTVVAGGVAVLSLALNLVVGALVSGSVSVPSVIVARVMVGYVVLTVLWAWLAAGITWVLRHTIGVLVVLLLTPLVVEPLASLLLQQVPALQPVSGASAWLPFDAGSALVLTGGGGGAGPTALTGGLVFAVVTALVLLVGTWRFRNSDA